MRMTKDQLITYYRAQFKRHKNKKVSTTMTKEQIINKLLHDSRAF